MKKALLVVPHQDDEINLAGNIIDRIKEKYDLFVVYSSLDKREKEGQIRKAEAYAACAVFGIDKEHILFLNYPDTSNAEGKHYYTCGDKRIIEDIKDVICKIKPELILATDFDYHSDHRMLSMAFETAMGQILQKEKGYRPSVLKGFCYETAYYSVEDYKASRLEKSVSTFDVLSDCSFEWKDRLSIQSNEKQGVIWRRKAYKALKCHKSQYAVLHAQSIINADNVFWNRRTDNLLFEASSIKTFSGNPELLRDYKIIDTDNIITIDARKIDYSKGVWKVHNNKEQIVIQWKEPVLVDRIVLHGNPNWESPVWAHIEINSGNQQLGILNEVKEYGRSTEIKFSSVRIMELVINISSGDNFGLSELEIFNGEAMVPDIVKNNTCILGKTNHMLDFIDIIGYKIIVFRTKAERKIKKIVQRHM